jgi:hypothetical protein
MDNLKEIEELFECRADSKYAGGYTYWCRECDKECNTGEARFECKDGRIIPVYIFCRYGCGKSWKLKISLPKNSGDSLH